MADIQYWDDTLHEQIETVESLLNQVPSLSSDFEKSALLDRAEKTLRDARGAKRSYKMETRLVPDPNERRRYEKQLARHEESLSALESDLRALREQADRNKLFVGADQDGGFHDDGDEADPTKAGTAMLNDADRIQDKTQASLDNTKRLIEESKETGNATLEELRNQADQIGNISNELDRLDSNLKRSEKLIKAFGKRMATDNLIQCFTCVNVLLLVGVVLYLIIEGGGLPGSRDNGEPSDPFSRRLRGME